VNSQAARWESCEVLSRLRDDSGELLPNDADQLLSKGTPWQCVAPFVVDRQWWMRQRPSQVSGQTPSFGVQVWDATVCFNTRDGVLWVDPGPKAPPPSQLPETLRPDLIAVTHAHYDHTAKLADYSDAFPEVPVIMTRDTCRLLALGDERELLLRACLDERTQRMDFLDEFILGQMTIRLIRAGHLLGAAMVEARTNAASLLVTGDFALRDVGGIEGADWPDASYDLVLMEDTATECGRLPVMDTRATRRPTLAAIDRAWTQGGKRLLIPARAKAEAQEIYAALVLAQQGGAFPEAEIGLAGLAYRVAQEYYRSAGGRRGPWWCDPLRFDPDFQIQNTILIQSGLDTREMVRAAHVDIPERFRAVDAYLVRDVPAYTHAGWSERMALAMGLKCRAIAPYHGVSLSVRTALRDAGRAVVSLSQQGEEWTATNSL